MVISVVTGQSQSQSRSRPQEIVDTSFSFISCIYYFSSRCFWLQYYFYRVHICVVPCCTVHCPLSTVEGQQTIKLMLFFINTNTELRVSISTKEGMKLMDRNPPPILSGIKIWSQHTMGILSRAPSHPSDRKIPLVFWEPLILGSRYNWNTTRNLLTHHTRGEISQFQQLVRCQYVEENINCCEEEIEPNFCLKSDKTK